MAERNPLIDSLRGTSPIRQGSAGKPVKRPDQGLDFETLLNEQLEKNRLEQNKTRQEEGIHSDSALQFSRHARERAAQRGIQLTEGLRSSLETAVEKARAKGARDVAVIDARQVFIVNIPNNTVITAISEPELKDSVFTNIDSAVIL